jgi:hypothetical protein
LLKWLRVNDVGTVMVEQALKVVEGIEGQGH